MNTLAVCLGISFGINVLLTVLVFKLSSDAFSKLERAHERTTQYTADLLNRLMTSDWSEYRTFITTAEGVPLDEPTPAEVELVPVHGPDRGGYGSRLGLRGWAANEEEDEIDPQKDMP